MPALREVIAKLGFDIDTKAIVGANQAFDGLLGGLSKFSGLAAAAIGALGLGSLKGKADELAAEAGDIGKAAIKSGLGFEEFQRLSYTSGLSTEKLTGVFRKLNQTVAAVQGKTSDAAGGLDDLGEGLEKVLSKKEAGGIFKALGLEATEDIGENFDNIIGKLAGMSNKTERTALSLKIFGKAGADLIPFLEKSPEALEKANAEFQLFGKYTSEDQKTLKEYANQTRVMALAQKSLTIAVVTGVVPALTSLFKAGMSGIKWLKEHVSASRVVYVGLGMLAAGFLLVKGAAISAAVSSAAAWVVAWGPVLVAVGAIFLLLEDIVAFLQGKTSLVGAFFDRFIGKGAGKSIAADISKDVDTLIAKLKAAEGLAGVADVIGDSIDKAIDGMVASVGDAWDLFWADMNEGIESGGSTFSDYVSTTFSRLGNLAGLAFLDAIRGLVGDRIFEALGGSGKGLDAAHAAVEAEGAAILKAREERTKDRAFVAPTSTQRQDSAGFADTRYNPIPTGLPANYYAPQGASSPGITETKIAAPYTANNSITVNVYGEDAGGIADEVKAGIDKSNKAHQVALEAMGGKK